MIPHTLYPEVVRPPPRREGGAFAYGRLETGDDGAWVAADARQLARRPALLRAVAVMGRVFRRR